MAVPSKLPRSYFKRRNPERIPTFKQTAPKSSTLTFGQAVGRRAYWLSEVGRPLAEDIRQVSKSTHLEATMDNWAHFKRQGRLTPEVAIITDGSVTRPLKGVSFGGEIIIQEPQSLGVLFDAVEKIYNTIAARASKRSKTGDYVNNIYILADNQVEVPYEMFVRNRDRLTQIFSQTARPVFFTIINTMPYAAKEERNTLPRGLFYGAWKDARSEYGAELALRFRYYTADTVPAISQLNTASGTKRNTMTTGTGPKSRSEDARTRERYSEGKPLSFPAINIGQPGAFNSGASAVILKARRKGAR